MYVCGIYNKPSSTASRLRLLPSLPPSPPLPSEHNTRQNKAAARKKNSFKTRPGTNASFQYRRAEAHVHEHVRPPPLSQSQEIKPLLAGLLEDVPGRHVSGRGPETAARVVHGRCVRGPPGFRLGDHIVVSRAWRRPCRSRLRGRGHQLPRRVVAAAATSAAAHDVRHTWVLAQSVRCWPLARVRVHQLQRTETKPAGSGGGNGRVWGCGRGVGIRETEAASNQTQSRPGVQPTLRHGTERPKANSRKLNQSRASMNRPCCFKNTLGSLNQGSSPVPPAVAVAIYATDPKWHHSSNRPVTSQSAITSTLGILPSISHLAQDGAQLLRPRRRQFDRRAVSHGVPVLAVARQLHPRRHLVHRQPEAACR